MTQLKLEAGKLYRTRDGGKFRCYATDGAGICSAHGAFLFDNGWESGDVRPDGNYYELNDMSSRDIIAPWIDLPAYPWHLIPPWFKWCAFDADGGCFAFEGKPELRREVFWNGAGQLLKIPKEYAPTLTCDWKESLVERPNTEKL